MHSSIKTNFLKKRKELELMMPLSRGASSGQQYGKKRSTADHTADENKGRVMRK